MDKTVRIILEAQDKSTGILGALGDKLSSVGLISQDFAKKLRGLSDDSVTTGEKLKTLGQVASIAIAGGMAVALDKAVKSAADYQSGLTVLVTSAGEHANKLKEVGDGIIAVSNATGYSAQQMVGPSGPMYLIESAGFHAADGLKVLKAAAEGARAENADLTKVADAVTSTLKDYHLKASDAADITSKLVAAVGSGKTNFEQFSGALHSVLPIASSAGVSFNDIAAATAAMTVHGMSADQATQNLADTIKHMVAPTQVQTKELGQLGMSSSDLAGMLGKQGLTGTLETLSETILKKMGPDGRVMLDAFNQSKDAAKDAQIMISKMPKSLQDMANAYRNGKMSVADYREGLKALPTDQANLMQQFKSLQDRAGGFNDLLKSGQPAAQTYQDALRRVTGDATGLNVALMLTGKNYNESVVPALKAVSGATADAGNHVKGFTEWQQTLNAKTAVAKESLHNMGISIGTALLPPLTSLMQSINKILIPMTDWATKHKDVVAAIMVAVGAIATLVASIALIGGAISKITTAFKGLQLAFGFFSKIGLISPWGIALMAIALIAILVITHWKTVSHFFEKLWTDISGFTKKHWKIILDLVLGPLGLIITNWKTITHFFDKLWNDVIGFFKKHWKVMLEIVLAPIAPIIAAWLAFPKFFDDLWNAIKDVFNKVKNWIVDFFKLEYQGVMLIWNGITAFFRGLINGVIGIVRGIGGFIVGIFRAEWNGMVAIWNGVTGFFSGLWGGLKSGMGAVVGIIKEPFRAAFNAVADLWNGTVGKLSFHAPSWVPGIGGKGFDMPRLPHLAMGTNYFQGGVALVGENGPELAIMPQGTQVVPNNRTQQIMNQQSPSQHHYHINVNVGAYAGQPGEIDKLGEAIWQSFQRIARRHGMADQLPNIGVRPQ